MCRERRETPSLWQLVEVILNAPGEAVDKLAHLIEVGVSFERARQLTSGRQRRPEGPSYRCSSSNC